MLQLNLLNFKYRLLDEINTKKSTKFAKFLSKHIF